MTEQMKVLVSDALAESGLAPLRAASFIELDVRTDLTPFQLIEIIPNYDALLVRSSTLITAAVIQAGKRLRVVARAGVGVDNIDVEAATGAGVIVVNAPTGNTVAAAEHTIAMLMAVARSIPQADAHVRGGGWKRNQFVGSEVRGKVLGSVGLGRVAQEVAHMAQGLGMRVVAYDPYVTEEYAAQRGVTLADLDILLAQADFVTLHVPLTPQTRHQINHERLLGMKKGAFLLNVARGGVIDEAALVDVINAGHLGGAALDVFEVEPLPTDSPLRTCAKIILTPHLGASTVEAQEKVAEDVALQVLDVLNDRPARYAVNAPIIPPKDLDFLIPYIDLAERLGRFLKQLGAQGVGDVEMTVHGALTGFDLAYLKAAVIKGLLADVVQVRVNLVNAALVAERRGLNLIEIKNQQHDTPYDNLITLHAQSGTQRWTVRGTVLQGEPHIVAINDLWVDVVAAGNFLVTGHQDRPGIIGRVGTVLGEADINISFMHVGRHAPRTEAIMVLGTDELSPPELLAKIAAFADIIWLKAIML
ncbi:MAG: phosphoglycerate dehydrogenase [Chloroflexota bacterium]|nr:phosphoglycerate dehydrogenase [Chloroflexota bacterium]